ncbi:hypothetical protein RR48_09991 [Papilio machaon]|uniref:Uncharacterized protein n=1 Tax=Papilio machaon TaxID=76193 RepID=A0A194RF66_PAPMA|nr:hypothetical protein RR48_09991 [Papilio machaon]
MTAGTSWMHLAKDRERWKRMEEVDAKEPTENQRRDCLGRLCIH